MVASAEIKRFSGIAAALLALIPTLLNAECRIGDNIPQALLQCRNWITYAPPQPFNPNTNTFPTEEQIRASLELLYNEGWRGLVTYSLDGNLRHVPRIAKQAGFDRVIAGLYWYDLAQLNRERTAAIEEQSWIDAFVVGNEGLRFGRYLRADLVTEIVWFKQQTGKPVATTETHDLYLSDPTLLDLGDWVFPTVHGWWAGQRPVSAAVIWTRQQFDSMQALRPSRIVSIKEAWWPTRNDPAATEENQSTFFQLLSATSAHFIHGEAFDQFYKQEPGMQGPAWGWHSDQSVPKRVVQDLAPIVRGASRIGIHNPSQGVFLLDYNGNSTWDGTSMDRFFAWGAANYIPIAGDWSGEGTSKAGVFDPATANWFLDMNGNGVWDGAATDRTFKWGSPGDTPVVGNWNGLTKQDKVGVFNPNTAVWLLDYNGNLIWDGAGTDRYVAWGSPGDKPVVGNWNGSGGGAKIGVFNPAQGWWLLDYNGNYAWEGAGTDRFLRWGSPGDTPVVGDWTGSGAAKIGVFNSTQAVWLLDYNGNYIWDGAGTDKYLAWGSAGDKPVVGDWNASGTAKIAVFNPTQGWWLIDYNGNYLWEGAVVDRFLKWGSPGDTPLAGKW